MTEDLHSVGVVVDEGNAFVARMPEDLRNNSWATSIGSLTYGIMRALAECPNCRGHFRVPCKGYEDTWEYMACTNCGGIWQRIDPVEEPAKKKRKKKAPKT